MIGLKGKWIKQTLCWFLVFVILFSAASLIRARIEKNRPWENPYSDVTEDLWSYANIETLNRAGILPSWETLNPEEMETRGNLVLYLYNMDNAIFPEKKKKKDKKDDQQGETPVFSDVSPEDAYYDAVLWAKEKGLVSGIGEGMFGPNELLTREQVCTILIRFASLKNLALPKVKEPDQFVDSLYIQGYARSSVTACQISGLINGYENGYFYPEDNMTRQECIAVLCRLLTAVQEDTPKGAELVKLSSGAYDSLYENYVDIPFTALVPESAAVDLSFFDRTVFIGDSVSLTLESYCRANGALGGAQFLCAGSMSATNMLSGIILPEYPKGSGQKPAIEESVAACGANVVYVMLGMDNIAYGLDRSTGDMVTVLTNITDRNPKAQIIVQSVTPMADSSTSYSEKLNNDVINAYNQRMQELCQENRWYYLNVAEVFKDENGCLMKEYCSDYGKMGMHFTYAGAEIWVNYLKTHVPEALLGRR